MVRIQFNYILNETSPIDTSYSQTFNHTLRVSHMRLELKLCL